MAYTTWTVGDTIRFCITVKDFCSTSPNFLTLGNFDIQKSGTSLTCDPWTYSCISNSGRRVRVKSMKTYSPSNNDVRCSNLSGIIYRELGSALSDSNGIVIIEHVITEQDRTDYLNAISDGNYYDIVFCIDDSLANIQHAKVQYGVTISSSIDTHYIEYDFSIFPIDFLNLISSNIVFISDRLGGYLPLDSNIQYIKTVYYSTEKKLRIHFKYTPSLSILSTIPLKDTRYIYNSSTGRVETLVTLTDMVSVAAYITGILILLFVLILGLLNPWTAVFGIALGIALLYYKLVEIQTGGASTGSGPATPETQIKVVKEYVDTYLSPDCDTLWSTCAATPPTCDAGTMRTYLACIGPARWAQCQQAKAKAGLPLTDCDIYETEIQNVDTGLANGTITPSQAKDRIINNVVNPVKEAVEEIITLVTCPPGQVYNKDIQKCEDVCWIPNPVGGCILSAKTGKTILLTGGLLIGGYVIFKTMGRPKA